MHHRCFTRAWIETDRFHACSMWAHPMPMNQPSSSLGFSPEIQMTLEIDGDQLAVAEVGRDYVVVQSDHSIQPTNATAID